MVRKLLVALFCFLDWDGAEANLKNGDESACGSFFVGGHGSRIAVCSLVGFDRLRSEF
jgi:hypothetical protein